MLCLTRTKGERIKIGEHCWVTVLATRSGKVRLGFHGPRSTPFVREELLPVRERFAASTVNADNRTTKGDR